jgi:hypothetical protein
VRVGTSGCPRRQKVRNGHEGRKRAEIFDVISNKALNSLFGLFVND